jgi:hypothetical protein
MPLSRWCGDHPKVPVITKDISSKNNNVGVTTENLIPKMA